VVGVCRIEAVVYSFYAALATFCFSHTKPRCRGRSASGSYLNTSATLVCALLGSARRPSVCRRRRVLRQAVARMQIKTNFYSLRPDQARAAVRQARSTGIFITYLAFTIRIPTPRPGLPDFYGVPGI
jgi:hypothetical protein